MTTAAEPRRDLTIARADSIENRITTRTPSPVLFVDHARALGGAERSLLLLLESLDRARFAPHLATQPGDLAEAARQLDVPVHEVALTQLRWSAAAPWRFARGVAALHAIITRERVRVVQSNTVRASVFAVTAARLAGRPHLWHVRDILPASAYVRSVCALSPAVIAVSEAVAVRLPCQHKVRVIHNGVPLADFTADRRADALRLRALWGVPEDATLIGHVARLARWKGQHDVIAAAEKVLRADQKVFIAIIGGDIFHDDPGYERELRTAAADRKLAPRLIFTGHQRDVPAMMAALDIVVHASLEEPFARILIEAGASARPVVAYADGGVGEAVAGGETGLLVPSGDRDALAAALVRLVRDPDLARRLGEGGRRRVSEHFDARRVTTEVSEVLERLTAADAEGAEKNISASSLP